METHGIKTDIALLALDHPGAQDIEYRGRRAFIAERAEVFLRDQQEVPHIVYTEEEHKTWSVVLCALQGIHEQHASKEYLDGKTQLGFSSNHIPQLLEISEKLKSSSNFSLEPVGGLIDPRSFLISLSKRTMFCTQYVRHHSRPEYTPEPDVIHDVLGHTPMLLNSALTKFSERLGRAAIKANEQQLTLIETLYWFTVEFGLIAEKGSVKAYGAGLLSSYGELAYAFSSKPEWKIFTIEDVLQTPHNYTEMQTTLFIIPSFEKLISESEEFLRKEGL